LEKPEISIHQHRVIDNKTITMTEALTQLIPLGTTMSIAVGYFYLSGYLQISEVLEKMALKNKIRIIMGNRTDKWTANEINEGVHGYQYKGEHLEKALSPKQALETELTQIEPDSMAASAAYHLRDLVAQGRISVKVYTGPSDYFHAKVYLIGREDPLDGYAILGSSNFSRGGFTGNSELNVMTKDVFPNLITWFDDLWDSSDVSDFNIELIDIIENHIKVPRLYSPQWFEDESGYYPASGPEIPPYIILRDYQKEAIRTWFKEAKGRGILEMATGTGKTITALATFTALYKNLQNLAVIIVCPYQHLVTQWEQECHHFKMKPVLCFKSRNLWEETLNAKITSFNIGALQSLCIITTNDTLSSNIMQESIAKLKGNVMIIADEAHHLGASYLRQCLPQNAEFRLGLSATPDRWYDPIGSDALKDYFENGVIYQFGLRQAIGEFLTEYYYYPHIVALTEEENETYIELSKEIARYFVMDEDYELSNNTTLKNLLIKRARLLSSAANKLIELRKLICNRKDSLYNLFYCGDNRVDGKRQIDEVTAILGSEFGMRVHPFTAEENYRERQKLLQNFENGVLQGLVAIRCLDEGVDVPATQTAYILASSTNPREFIQRRGRILRKHPDKKYAYIHDFIVIPRNPEDVGRLDAATFNIERKMMARELKRFNEFAGLAENGPQASLEILEIAKMYHLLDI